MGGGKPTWGGGGQPLIMGSWGRHVLSKRQQFKDSTLQNGILGQFKKKH